MNLRSGSSCTSQDGEALLTNDAPYSFDSSMHTHKHLTYLCYFDNNNNSNNNNCHNQSICRTTVLAQQILSRTTADIDWERNFTTSKHLKWAQEAKNNKAMLQNDSENTLK